jgi:hypothetical protein
LTLFTKLYSDDEVLKKVVVIKADRYTWYAPILGAVAFSLPFA